MKKKTSFKKGMFSGVDKVEGGGTSFGNRRMVKLIKTLEQVFSVLQWNSLKSVPQIAME